MPCRAVLLLCLLAGLGPVFAQQAPSPSPPTSAPAAAPAQALSVPFNLAATGNTTQTVDPGEFRVVLENRLPQGRYDITIRRELIPIAAIPLAGIGSIGSLTRLIPELSVDPCDQLVAATKALNDATAESQVPARRVAVEAALKQDTCKNPSTLADARAVLGSTTQELQHVFIRDGERLTVTITRQVAQGQAPSWVLVLETEPRGEWLTSFGVSFVPDSDERYTTEATADQKFKITKENHVFGLKPMGSVFFSWLSSKQARKNLAWSPAAGFGLGSDTTMVFGGVAATYNRNVTFLGGIAVTGQRRLLGRYSPDQEVAASLTEDQLHQTVFRPSVQFGVAVRFDRNPFKKDPAASTPSTPAAQPAGSGTPAAPAGGGAAPTGGGAPGGAAPAEPGVKPGPQPPTEASRDSDIKLRFDARGTLREPAVMATLLQRAKAATDVFLVSHGWWNDESSADCFYRRIVGGLEQQKPEYLTEERYKPLFVTLYWPSALFPMEPSDCTTDPRRESGAAIVFTQDLVRAWAGTAFPDASARAEFNAEATRLAVLLDRERIASLSDVEADELVGILVRWRDASGPPGVTGESGEPETFTGTGAEIARRWRQRPELRTEAALPASARKWLNFGNAFTFWTMKARAGVVGAKGLYEVVKALQPLREQNNIRLHMIGHSFGGKLLSASLTGSGAAANRVDSLVILQGAFSHFAFASREEINQSGVKVDRPGAYREILASNLIRGPIVVTYSTADLPNRLLYPAGVALVNDVTEAARAPRYGSLGANGFRGSPSVPLNLATSTLASLESQAPRAISVDASGVILGHSDLLKQQVFKLIWDTIGQVL